MIDLGNAYFCCDECPICEGLERRLKNAEEFGEFQYDYCGCDKTVEDKILYNRGGCSNCAACWNREMPEEKEGENMRTKVLETEPEKTRYIRIAVDEDTYSDLVNGAESTHIVVNAEDVVESEPVKCNDVCENITPELVADLRTKLRALETENATLKECIIRMTLRMNELY